MKVTILKRGDGKVDVIVASSSIPPVPPVALVGVSAKQVAAESARVMGDVKRASALPEPGS